MSVTSECQWGYQTKHLNCFICPQLSRCDVFAKPNTPENPLSDDLEELRPELP